MLSRKYSEKSSAFLKSNIFKLGKFINNSIVNNANSNYVNETENEPPVYSSNKPKEKLVKSQPTKKSTIKTLKDYFEFKPGNRPPTTLSLIDPKGGTLQLDEDIPLSVLLEKAPKIFKQESKKLATHFRQRFFLVDHPNLFREQSDTMHEETFIQYEFRTDEDFEYWNTGSDSDWSEGYSKCDFYKTDRGTAIFEGILSNKVVKDGRTERAGWCSIKSKDTMSFNLKKRYEEWGYYSHLLIKCRGDGRSYKIMIHSPESWDITWGDSNSYPLHTHGGPYWQFEMIPFSRFFSTIGGRIMDGQKNSFRAMQGLIFLQNLIEIIF
ncbi:CIA30 domain-containing protein [Meloidogyne graminicola]|uniref:CIA30 domain-containing protein n=1 Tax=Meloidogyne graminicola TaxID=189291 RepID=A0A8S9ZUS3_9BILA|nr:CIA30 domain-containing protein [Meloidogyne graminicola]